MTIISINEISANLAKRYKSKAEPKSRMEANASHKDYKAGNPEGMLAHGHKFTNHVRGMVRASATIRKDKDKKNIIKPATDVSESTTVKYSVSGKEANAMVASAKRCSNIKSDGGRIFQSKEHGMFSIRLHPDDSSKFEVTKLGKESVVHEARNSDGRMTVHTTVISKDEAGSMLDDAKHLFDKDETGERAFKSDKHGVFTIRKHPTDAGKFEVRKVVREEVTESRFEVVKSRMWKNSKTGATASVYGAHPATSTADQPNWKVHDVGWTIKDNQKSTVGIGRKPFDSEDEAKEHLKKINKLHEDGFLNDETLNELSLNTLKRYRDKADNHIITLEKLPNNAGAEFHKKNDAKLSKRYTGTMHATSRLSRVSGRPISSYESGPDNIDNLTELSKSTLQSYRNKAGDDAADLIRGVNFMSGAADKHDRNVRAAKRMGTHLHNFGGSDYRADADKLNKKAISRGKGMRAADKKLAKEDFTESDLELITEISKRLAQRYGNKAAVQLHAAGEGARRGKVDPKDIVPIPSDSGHSRDKAATRLAGIKNAIKRIVKEESILEADKKKPLAIKDSKSTYALKDTADKDGKKQVKLVTNKVAEADEQFINELSQHMLQSYINKSGKSRNKMFAKKIAGKVDPDTANATIDKRDAGRSRAIGAFNKRAAEEEVIDELSKATLKSYVKKAGPDGEFHRAIADRKDGVADSYEKAGDKKWASEVRGRAGWYHNIADRRETGIETAKKKLKEESDTHNEEDDKFRNAVDKHPVLGKTFGSGSPHKVKITNSVLRTGGDDDKVYSHQHRSTFETNSGSRNNTRYTIQHVFHPTWDAKQGPKHTVHISAENADLKDGVRGEGHGATVEDAVNSAHKAFAADHKAHKFHMYKKLAGALT